MRKLMSHTEDISATRKRDKKVGLERTCRVSEGGKLIF